MQEKKKLEKMAEKGHCSIGNYILDKTIYSTKKEGIRTGDIYAISMEIMTCINLLEDGIEPEKTINNLKDKVVKLCR